MTHSLQPGPAMSRGAARLRRRRPGETSMGHEYATAIPTPNQADLPQ
jgi:hypothetical protein